VRFEFDTRPLCGGTAGGAVVREGSAAQRFSGRLEPFRTLEDRGPYLTQGGPEGLPAAPLRTPVCDGWRVGALI